MIAQPWCVGAPHQRFEPLEVLRIRLGYRAEVHRYAMLHDPILLDDLIENRHRTAGIAHEIFRNDFEPVHHRLAREDVAVMRNAESDSDSVVLIRIEAIAGHGGSLAGAR